MTRTLPLATLEDGQVKRVATKPARTRAPRLVPEPTPPEIARALALFGKLSPGGQAAAMRFIEVLARDEARSRGESDHNI